VKFVLIAEDDPAIRLLVAELLTATGLRVSSAENGAEALHLLARETPDLIITDLEMPVMGGLDLLKAVRASRWSTVPVIVLSARRVPPEFQALGVAAVIAKPFDIEALERTVESVLNQSHGSATPLNAPSV